MTLGERILKYRKKAGISQEELADKLNVTRQSISLWETDQTVPSLDSLITLASIFDISLDELCGRKRIADIKDSNIHESNEGDAVDISNQTATNETADYIAYSETQYSKNILRRVTNIASKEIYIICISMMALIITATTAIILTDNTADSSLIVIPIVFFVLFVALLISTLIRNKIQIDKYVKSGIGTVFKYRFYSNCIDIESTSKQGFSKLSIAYSDIKKTIEDNGYYYLFINNVIYTVDKQNTDGDFSAVKTLIKAPVIGGNNKTTTYKKRTGINTLLIVMFILSILSLSIALFAVVISIRYAPLPEYPFTMVEYMWEFFLIIPIPLASTILGIVFLTKKYKCLKNIIAGVIMCVLLSIYGSFTFAFKNHVNHDFAYIKQIEVLIDIDLPDKGYASYETKTATKTYANGMVKFDNREEILDSIQNDYRFKINTDLIPANFVNSYDLAVTKNYNYFLLYDTACNEANNALDGNHNGHRFIYLAYSVEENILYIVDFVK